MSTDNQLMQEFLACDREAFNELMRRHAARLTHYLSYRYGRQCMFDRETCEDITQDAFLRVHQVKFGEGTPFNPQHGSFSNWLYTIAIRLAINECRRRRAGDVDPDTLPDARGVEPHLRIDLRDCLSRLDPDDYSLVVRRYSEGCAYVELEDELGATSNALRQRLHRAMLKLRECMDEQQRRKA
jgi:RNA polymerase sigma-70 factor (ECF subfamily)